MISLTRFHSGERIAINPDLIERIEETPDTVVTYDERQPVRGRGVHRRDHRKGPGLPGVAAHPGHADGATIRRSPARRTRLHVVRRRGAVGRDDSATTIGGSASHEEDGPDDPDGRGRSSRRHLLLDDRRRVEPHAAVQAGARSSSSSAGTAAGRRRRLHEERREEGERRPEGGHGRARGQSRRGHRQARQPGRTGPARRPPGPGQGGRGYRGPVLPAGPRDDGRRDRPRGDPGHPRGRDHRHEGTPQGGRQVLRRHGRVLPHARHHRHGHRPDPRARQPVEPERDRPGHRLGLHRHPVGCPGRQHLLAARSPTSSSGPRSSRSTTSG